MRFFCLGRRDDKIGFDLLSDDLFVRMMLEFSSTAREFGCMSIYDIDRIRKVLSRYLDVFKPDAMVVDRNLALKLLYGSGPEYCRHIDDDFVQCVFFGILTRMCDGGGIMPDDSILMIRDAAPTPVSKVIRFDLV